MLPNCKHSPHRDQPEATLEKMSEFVGAMTRAGIGKSSANQQVAADLHG